MPLNEKEKNDLIAGVAEDLKLFADTFEDGKPSEQDVLAWRSGYIAGYNRSVQLQAEASAGNTSLQE
jgi:hypothetical protein